MMPQFIELAVYGGGVGIATHPPQTAGSLGIARSNGRNQLFGGRSQSIDNHDLSPVRAVRTTSPVTSSNEPRTRRNVSPNGVVNVMPFSSSIRPVRKTLPQHRSLPKCQRAVS